MLIRSFGGSAARLIFAVFAVFAFSATADAQYITYVASNGNDANPCTVITAPCKTLQRAVTVTSANGTVRVLTPLVSSVFINKNITISGDGVPIVGQITIGGATAVVTLRGLALDGVGGYVNGIRIDSAAAVHIEDCTVERYTQAGIHSQASTATELFIYDTVSRDNGFGLLVASSSNNVRVAIENSRFDNNGSYGVNVDYGAVANVVRSAASGNTGTGFSFTVSANVTETTAADNGGNGFEFGGAGTLASSVARSNAGYGLSVGPSAGVVITNVVITSSPASIYNAGTLYTRQNNTVGGSVTGAAAVPFGAY